MCSDEAAFCFRQFDKQTQITELHKAIDLNEESQALQALNLCIESGVEADVLNAIENLSTALRLTVKKGYTKVIEVQQLLLAGELASAANDPARAADKVSLHRGVWAKAIEKHLELKKLLIAFEK